MVIFTLTLVRHGETKANKDRVIQGQLDVPLSEEGLVQANHLATRLRNKNYTHVYSSDLSRASKTAQTIIEKNCLLGQSVRIQLDQRLRERKYGEVEGKSVTEMKKLVKTSNKSLHNFSPVGAETVENVRDRAISFFKDLCQMCLEVEMDCHCQVCKQEDQSTFASFVSQEQQHFASKYTFNYQSKASDAAAIPKLVTSNQSNTETVHQTKGVSQSQPFELSDRLNFSTRTAESKLSQSVSSVDSECDIKSDCQCLVANVLLVSHGGFLKEMIKYFVEELGCKVPGGKDQAARISPNTGLSVFTVSVSLHHPPKMTCLIIHDQNHLIENCENLALCNEEAV